jgi:AcrR family transcriptional regulator
MRGTRDVILDAAERRFAERGFAGVSVRGIAAEAGLKNQASLYHHFRNKRALYEAVLARGVETILALIDESARAGGGDPLDPAVLDLFLGRVHDYLAEHPHLPRLIQRAGLDGNPGLRTAALRLLRPLYAQGLEVLGQAGGPWDRSVLPHLAAGIYHLIFGYFANGPLLEGVLQEDLYGPAMVARQRQFLRTAVGALLGVGQRPVSGKTRRLHP